VNDNCAKLQEAYANHHMPENLLSRNRFNIQHEKSNETIKRTDPDAGVLPKGYKRNDHTQRQAAVLYHRAALAQQ
jgi:hypothetical protein